MLFAFDSEFVLVLEIKDALCNCTALFSGLRTRIDEFVATRHPDSDYMRSMGSQGQLPDVENHMCESHDTVDTDTYILTFSGRVIL